MLISRNCYYRNYFITGPRWLRTFHHQTIPANKVELYDLKHIRRSDAALAPEKCSEYRGLTWRGQRFCRRCQLSVLWHSMHSTQSPLSSGCAGTVSILPTDEKTTLFARRFVNIFRDGRYLCASAFAKVRFACFVSCSNHETILCPCIIVTLHVSPLCFPQSRALLLPRC